MYEAIFRVNDVISKFYNSNFVLITYSEIYLQTCKMLKRKIFMDTIFTNENYAIDTVSAYKNSAKRSRQHARFHQRSSSTEGHLPPKVVFRSSSTEGRLPPKVVFHQRSSSTEGRLPPKVVFNCR